MRSAQCARHHINTKDNPNYKEFTIQLNTCRRCAGIHKAATSSFSGAQPTQADQVWLFTGWVCYYKSTFQSSNVILINLFPPLHYSYLLLCHPWLVLEQQFFWLHNKTDWETDLGQGRQRRRMERVFLTQTTSSVLFSISLHQGLYRHNIKVIQGQNYLK